MSLSQTVYWTDRVVKLLLELGLFHRSRCTVQVIAAVAGTRGCFTEICPIKC